MSEKTTQRFNYLTSEINASYHEAALKFGLSDSAMQILYAVCNSGDCCPVGDICRLSGMSKQTVHSALRKLEGEGILYLENQGGKKKTVCLTERGKEVSAVTAVCLIDMENRIFDEWTEEERDSYLMLTQRFLNSFRQAIQVMPSNNRRGAGTAEESRL